MGLSGQQLWKRGRNIFGTFLLLISIPCSLQVKIFLYHTIPTPGQGHSVKNCDFWIFCEDSASIIFSTIFGNI